MVSKSGILLGNISGRGDISSLSTVSRDEEVIREYIRNQENEDTRLEQLSMWK
jgi:hypothetical protein